ncbi:MAG TPA: hypothetical protein H9825_04915 [Candidatus Sphingobacterium stercorigallinarum]|nr:hypothetical protein [Candidatus Sphingobacterium stercorigallinarum]
MNRILGFLTLAISCLIFLQGCGLIEGIFKAGMWWGILLVVGFIVIFIWLISKLFRGGRD